MTRLDKVAIVFTLFLVLAAVLGKVTPPADAPDIGRRPLPETPPAATAPNGPAPPIAAAPGVAPPVVPLAPAPQRVRRPLPAASPNDPIVSVNAEAIPPHAVATGTAFSVASGLWFTARHVANGDCQRVLIILGRAATPAEIKYLAPEADLALLQTRPAPAPALPISRDALSIGDSGYSFGFPHQQLGGFSATLMGRSRMRLEGRLQGTGPVLVWAEDQRYPDTLEALPGISGGPMFNTRGNVVGIMVAASSRRGRTYSVAPEILQDAEQQFSYFAPATFETPAAEVTGPDVSLPDAAAALQHDARIVPTVCVPAGS